MTQAVSGNLRAGHLTPFLQISIDNTYSYSTFAQSAGVDFFVAHNAHNTASVRLRKRKAYPGTFFEYTNEGVIFGYGVRSPEYDSEEYLHCTLNQYGLTISRDSLATLPLFYGYSGSRLCVSSSYADIVQHLPQRTLSAVALADALVVHDYVPQPYISEVNVLWAGEALRFHQGKLYVERPPSRSWQASHEVPPTDPKQFQATFSEHLDYFLASRVHGHKTAYELSGGLDSATLPQYAVQKGKQINGMVSLGFPGAFGQSQRTKIQSVITRAPTSTLYEQPLIPDYNFPLSRMITTQNFRPTYFESIYLDAMLPVYKQLQQQNYEVIVHGHGADELFGNVVIAQNNTVAMPSQRHRPSYLTPHYYEMRTVVPTQHPHQQLKLPSSTMYISLTHQHPIDHGLWPVSPFINPDLYTWAQGLPAYLRSNKNILRAYHAARNFAPEIYNAADNEDFATFFGQCFVAGVYDSTVHMLLEHSLTVKLGLVDANELRRVYRRATTMDYPARDADLFALYTWMIAEINAQFTPHDTIA